MDNRNKWKSPEAIIVMALILIIFSYMGIDMVKTKPQIKSDLKEVKTEYVELSGFLDQKLPEIDSTLKIQADQISNQGSQIDSLNQTVREILED